MEGETEESGTAGYQIISIMAVAAVVGWLLSCSMVVVVVVVGEMTHKRNYLSYAAQL